MITRGGNQIGIESKQEMTLNLKVEAQHSEIKKAQSIPIWCLHQLVKRFKFGLPPRNKTGYNLHRNKINKKLKKTPFNLRLFT
jgi:hypothetical protein